MGAVRKIYTPDIKRPTAENLRQAFYRFIQSSYTVVQISPSITSKMTASE